MIWGSRFILFSIGYHSVSVCSLSFLHAVVFHTRRTYSSTCPFFFLCNTLKGNQKDFSECLLQAGEEFICFKNGYQRILSGIIEQIEQLNGLDGTHKRIEIIRLRKVSNRHNLICLPCIRTKYLLYSFQFFSLARSCFSYFHRNVYCGRPYRSNLLFSLNVRALTSKNGSCKPSEQFSLTLTVHFQELGYHTPFYVCMSFVICERNPFYACCKNNQCLNQ